MKRRKIEEGKFKKVIQTIEPEKKQRDDLEKEEEVNPAKRKKAEEPQRILGGIWKDMELAEEVDWQKRRQEILEELEKEEEKRVKRVEKAKKLEQSWELMRQCRRILKENHTKWQDDAERKEEIDKNEKRAEQMSKAAKKKSEFKEKQDIREKNLKITMLLEKIPKSEAQRIEEEVRRAEKLELREVKENLWKKWRGKAKVLDNKTKIPKETDKLDKKLREIEEKILKYENRKKERIRMKEKKQKEWKDSHKMIVEDTWAMIRWLHQFIDENRFEWERRKKLEIKEGELEKWKNMEEEEMIQILRETEEKEETTRETRKERAQRRRKYWKEWRQEPRQQKVGEVEIREGIEEEKLEEGAKMGRMKMMSMEMLERRRIWKKEMLEDKVNGNKKQLIANKPEDLVEGTVPRLEQNLNLINRPAKEEGKLREDEESEAEVMRLFKDEEQEEGGVGWCMICAHTPCLCLLSLLEGRIRNLKPHDHLALETSDQGEIQGKGNLTLNPEISPGKVGHLAELEGGGHVLGAGEKRTQEEEQNESEEVREIELVEAGVQDDRDDQVVGHGGNKILVGLLEGRGTFQGTPTPPEPAPGNPMEDQGTIGALVPQGVLGEESGERKKSILDRMMIRSRTGESKVQRKKTPSTAEKKTPSRKGGGKKKQEEVHGAEKMRKLMETWKKGVNVEKNVMTVTNLDLEAVKTVEEVELVGHEVDHVAGEGGRDGGGGGEGIDVRKENLRKEPSRIELMRKKFSQGEGEDHFQLWKASRGKRKLEDEEGNNEKEKKKIRPPGVKNDSDRFKIKFQNQTNTSSRSLLRGRDTGTPAGQGGGEAEGGGVLSSRTLLSEQNKKQRDSGDGSNYRGLVAAAELDRPIVGE